MAAKASPNQILYIAPSQSKMGPVAKNAPWLGDHSVSWITPIPKNLSRIRMAVERTSDPLAIALTAAASARRAA